MTSDFSALAARVERLEQQYRWLKSEVVTEKFVLADSDGKTKASLGLVEGVPTLIFFDASGKACVVLRVSAEGPALHLLASETDAGLELTAGEGGPDISLFDASGKLRAALKVTPALQELGAPILAMYNPNAASVALTVVGGRGGLNLADSANLDTAIRLQLDDQGPIIVCVKDGKVLWTAP
jgi:hypothetical protein